MKLTSGTVISKVREVRNKPNTIRCEVELPKGHALLLVPDDGHVRLGYPLEDMIVHVNNIKDADHVFWCPGAQEWVQR